jgi:predicted DNA-binding antitoxin AbrB/MazE fold protein
MIHSLDAIYDQGVFRPVEPLKLPNGLRVHLRVEEQNGTDGAETLPEDKATPTLLERMKDIVGVIDDLPDDSSVNLDHYLYGTPKR